MKRHRRMNSQPSLTDRLSTMMNMKLKHVFFLSISFCVVVYFIDQRYSIAPQFSSASDSPTQPLKSQSSDDHVANTNLDYAKPQNTSHDFHQREGPQVPVESLTSMDHHAQRTPADALPLSGSKDHQSGSTPSASVHVVMVLKDAAKNSNLQRKFDITIASIFRHSRYMFFFFPSFSL